MDAKPSSTARAVTAARAVGNRLGALDDPYAEGMLTPSWRRAVKAASRRPLRWPTVHNRSLAYLVARTRAFDEVIVRALDAGVVHVVIIGAGCDSRAWRLARPGLEYVEVDHPATQADKRTRAPAGDGPTYVAADLDDEHLDQRLVEAGVDRARPALFTLEGVTMYLEEATVARLLTELGQAGGPDSRLAANFGVGFDDDSTRRGRARSRVGRRVVARRQEPIRSEVSVAEAPALLAAAGWTVDELLTGPDLARRFLGGSAFADVPLNPRAYVVTATRA